MISKIYNKLTHFSKRFLNLYFQFFIVLNKVYYAFTCTPEEFKKLRILKIYKLTDISKLMLKKYVNLLSVVFEFYDTKIFTERCYLVARKWTRPLNWSWIWLWRLVYNRFKGDSNLLLRDGIHCISAPPGGGKTSLCYQIIETLSQLTGRGSYINTPFEIPRHTKRDRFGRNKKILKHRLYDFLDFFSGGRLRKVPNKYKYASIVIDEIHRILDYRQNGSLDYADKFKPFIDYGVVIRHQIKRIYCTTQMNKTDIQLMQIAMYHEVEIDRGFDYKAWIKDGLFKNRILGWYVNSYKVSVNPYGGMDKELIKSWYLKCTCNMEYYNTYSMAGAYDHLPMDN